MSVYTTELRHIIEMLASSEIEPYGVNYQTLIEIARPKLFNFDYPINEKIKEDFEKNFMKHFYLREICTGSVGRWKLFLDSWLNDNMGYYNPLIESALLKIDPFKTFEHNRTETRTGEKTEEKNYKDNVIHSITRSNETRSSSDSTNTNSGSATENQTHDRTTKNAFSDTPQGALTGVDNLNYITQAEKDTTSESEIRSKEEKTTSIGNAITLGTSKDTDSGNNRKTSQEEIEHSSNDIFITKESGFDGAQSEMLLKYRETFLNIYKEIFDNMETLFMGLY